MLEEALKSLIESLSYDGYILEYEQSPDDTIDIFIKASPDACADCLVSKDILENIISNILKENSIFYTKLIVHMPQ